MCAVERSQSLTSIHQQAVASGGVSRLLRNIVKTRAGEDHYALPAGPHVLRMAVENGESGKEESAAAGEKGSVAPPSGDGGKGEDFDAILTTLGTGKWNVLCYIAVAYWNTVLPYHTIAGAFLSPSVAHTCRTPPNAITPTLILPTDAHNASFSASFNASYATDASLQHDASCSYLSEDPATGKVEEMTCTEWDFDNTTFTSTVTSEFGLVCEYRYLRAAHQSIYMGGMMVGACLNGFLADRFGRWTMIAISTVTYTVLALGSAWLPSMGTLLAARFLLGTMHPTSLMTGYILVTEITEIKKRSVMAMLSLSAWSVGATLWGLWAYLERNWRWLQTYVSLFCPIFLPALIFLKESPRWLAVMGRHQEALSVLQVAAKINGTTLPPTDKMLRIMQEVQQQSKSEVEARSNVPMARRVLDQVTILFRTRKLLTITIVTCIGYFSVAMVYFGLLLAATTYDVDPFMYVAISGLVEIPSNLNIFVVEIIGRKKSGMGCFGLCAVTLLLQPLVPNSLKWLSITLVMIGKLSSTAAFSVMFLYTSELFPTEIRTQGMSAGMISSRIGAFIAPFFMSALEPTHPWAVSVVFGLAAAVAAVSFVPLWETMNTCLPDTVAQLEEMDVHGKVRPCFSEQDEVNTKDVTSV
ncbi:solute carrier family 22 member 7-like [Scylla paramamosain]|uniref:solute carrier family 22 member 7-like n=1 Tax=Scylla paramamosain TaxID=85552 RepID=UPI003082BEFC